ncbi:hypothetical protein HH310_09640 [Actinoplanes sp. TBRC 11911]|uniref:hypothetical protein n=1 Tax=Actinoplanes sp. TBRC 11911 TaxID=2729386 RepID=UPI00145F7323|nr:hypothetical protein [Actinoplanes sp. TBRC 11911]NMO51452.1 hypothetical protein [Actinoplanes sp. TBRC 11911]
MTAPEPAFRELRVFAVDPGMTARFATAVLNERIARIRWEPLEPGPVGEYLEIRDEDKDRRRLFPPIDLDRPELLAQYGLSPSDGNPWFRQQMVYAVAMTTISRFEQGLGRPAQWAPLPEPDVSGSTHRRRLVLFPHYQEMANAHYDPEAGLCFGYFAGMAETPLAGTVVFTCLSQDVVAHELTHALLKGMNVGFQDAGPVHEAFADMVALFQHFDDSEVLREQIRAIGGDLERRSQLGAVGMQMGEALGLPDGLRNALGSSGPDGVWRPRRPDPHAYQNAKEDHERGDILVAAVFDAFRAIYTARVADLRRIATGGTGVLPAGEAHPDLVHRMSVAAAATAGEVQQMCIRALDYLPPVGVTFGDFLQAMVTADRDVDPEDAEHRRVAVLEAFRGYGMLPSGVLTVSADTMAWPGASSADQIQTITDFVRDLARRTTYWTLPTDRARLWELREGWKRDLAAALRSAKARVGPVNGAEALEVSSCDLRRRAGSAGSLSLEWVIKIVQDGRGVTLLVDADSGRLNYLITTGSGPGERLSLLERSSQLVQPVPARRLLRAYAVDPDLGIELASAGINEVTLAVPWERGPGGADILQPGPAGEYLEVIDHDPASGAYYAPVDLNRPAIVAQHGLTPSESNPQFHQQMTYAVAMRIIRDFESALGRLVLWSPRRRSSGREEYVRRLRIHPHALREANAYYSPARKALLFGYFTAPSVEDGPQLTVFTCLSHDIVAHEVTHAILDGIHRRFDEPTNPDVLAFHEAFADLVALFEHFSVPDVLVQQIAETRGDLTAQNRLGELARQFGRATGRRGALRTAIGKADPTAYRRVSEPHERGAILVAAVFDAFLTIYRARVADLLRIATQGTGVLPKGRLHPDLVRRLADEAAAAAGRVLRMCIRALDYCPPVDITFGDYLRALITADVEHGAETHDRVAFVEAFRRHGIVPEDVRTLSPDGLLWRPTAAAPDENDAVVLEPVRKWAVDIPSWHLTRDRRELFDLTRGHRRGLHRYLSGVAKAGGWALRDIDPALPFEVHSLRPSTGSDVAGRPDLHWIIELIQAVPQPGGATLLGGCTLIVDGRTGRVRYTIHKRLDPDRRERQLAYLSEPGGLAATYFTEPAGEPFALLHRG